MNLIQLYQCFADETRLRILHLLMQGSLCVCHFQTILDAPQVKISKHLAYLKKKGVVVATRHQNWMVYHLATDGAPELSLQLQCLAACVRKQALYQGDLKRLRKIAPQARAIANECGVGCC